MGAKILVVEDEVKLTRLVADYLEAAGFQVLKAYTGKEALALFRHEKPDLVILDLMLPEIDGLEVARIIRRESSTPIIMLTARVEESDRILGLEIGADDYITKPFSLRELVARVRAVLRRAKGEFPALTIKVADIEIDPQKRTVTVAGKPVDLTPTEFEILNLLARHPGRVFTRLEILEKVQPYAYEGYERTVDVHIKNLRKKIEPDPRNPRYIITVYGVGYKLAEE
ncbi:MAG: response regulator transcription factor [Anaerolineae bacterium]|nr:response regulator transcription factor [Anaerolineae bacterium]MDW8101515.1 response regulator transcription factor [Anaerolineae bacterium]